MRWIGSNLPVANYLWLGLSNHPHHTLQLICSVVTNEKVQKETSVIWDMKKG